MVTFHPLGRHWWMHHLGGTSVSVWPVPQHSRFLPLPLPRWLWAHSWQEGLHGWVPRHQCPSQWVCSSYTRSCCFWLSIAPVYIYALLKLRISCMPKSFDQIHPQRPTLHLLPYSTATCPPSSMCSLLSTLKPLTVAYMWVGVGSPTRAQAAYQGQILDENWHPPAAASSCQQLFKVGVGLRELLTHPSYLF